jgi:hypothetical protein
VLEPEARGCPRCALNFEAENMIDRFMSRVVLPGILLIVMAMIACIYFFALPLVARNR